MSPLEVLLVEDHQIVRDGLKALLERHAEYRVIGELDNGPDAIQFCKRKHPSLVIMDLNLPGLNGAEATVEILRHSPESRVVVLSVFDDEQSIVGAIRAGARGFVVKKASMLDLLDALRTVSRGGSYLCPQVSNRLLLRLRRGEEDNGAPRELTLLSPRELQVLRLVAGGKSSKDIAVLLDLGLQTVRGYRKTMMKKLGINNVAGLTQFALAHGLTGPSPYDQPAS